MNKRWYDADPVITNAINLIQNSENERKNLMVNFIIEEAKTLGVDTTEEVFDCFWHKRQDEDDKYIQALEALKTLELEAQREIAFKLITKFKSNLQI